MRQVTITQKMTWMNTSTAALGRLAAFIILAVLTAHAATAAPKKLPGCDISVITEPPQAAVTFDGKKEHALTPVILNTTPGIHSLVISKAGYVEWKRRFNVAPDQARLLIDTKLEPVLGLVLIHSEPSGAEITIDDAQRGRTPLLLTDLRPGRYRVRSTLQGALPVERNLDVVDRIPQKLDIVMRSDSGDIKCSSEPSGAEVTVNGAARGQTPCTVSGLPPGNAAVVISLAGYQSHEETVAIRAGVQAAVEAALKPLPAILEVFSIPDGAIIYVDNERRGKAPLTLTNLPPGECRIRAELPAHEPLARTVDLKQGKTSSEEFRLERVAGALEVTTTPPGVKVVVDNVDRGVTAADTNKPEAASMPLVVENLDPGSHTILMTRKGYEKVSTTIEIEKSKKASLAQDLKKMFIPDMLLRIGDGPNDMYTGAVAERFPNGDLKLELKPGIFRLFRKSEIQSEKPLIGTDQPRKE